MAEILLGEELPQLITASELTEKIDQVAQPYRDNLLNHSLDDAIIAYRTWASLTKTEHFRSSIRVLDLTVIIVVLLSACTGSMFMLEYYNTGMLPTYERLSVTFLPLSIVVMVQYCMNDSMIMAMVAKFLFNKYKK